MRVLTLLLALLIASAVHAETFQHDGRERSYLIEVPQGLPLPAPTVFVLHGGSRSAAKIRRSTRFHETGAAQGFVTVYPDGVGNQWNDAREAPAILRNHDGESVDDVGFLESLARHMIAEGIAEPDRIYATGSSNGGMMTFRLACESADVFAAFTPVIASLPAKAEISCAPSAPVPLMMINGTDDRLIPWDGGQVAPMFPGDRGRVLPVEQAIYIFRRINGCGPPEIVDGRHPDSPDGIALFVTRYSDCDLDREILLYRFEGMGHRWPETRQPVLPGRFGEVLGEAPRDFPAALHIWDFLSRFRLPR